MLSIIFRGNKAFFLLWLPRSPQCLVCSNSFANMHLRGLFWLNIFLSPLPLPHYLSLFILHVSLLMYTLNIFLFLSFEKKYFEFTCFFVSCHSFYLVLLASVCYFPLYCELCHLCQCTSLDSEYAVDFTEK